MRGVATSLTSCAARLLKDHGARTDRSSNGLFDAPLLVVRRHAAVMELDQPVSDLFSALDFTLRSRLIQSVSLRKVVHGLYLLHEYLPEGILLLPP